MQQTMQNVDGQTPPSMRMREACYLCCALLPLNARFRACIPVCPTPSRDVRVVAVKVLANVADVLYAHFDLVYGLFDVFAAQV